MATLTIRNLDPGVVSRLKARAAASHRSVEAEVRDVLTRLVPPSPNFDLRAIADQIAERTRGRAQTDGAALIREERDARLARIEGPTSPGDDGDE